MALFSAGWGIFGARVVYMGRILRVTVVGGVSGLLYPVDPGHITIHFRDPYFRRIPEWGASEILSATDVASGDLAAGLACARARWRAIVCLSRHPPSARLTSRSRGLACKMSKNYRGAFSSPLLQIGP